jgi:hypothetical protein
MSSAVSARDAWCPIACACVGATAWRLSRQVTPSESESESESEGLTMVNSRTAACATPVSSLQRCQPLLPPLPSRPHHVGEGVSERLCVVSTCMPT